MSDKIRVIELFAGVGGFRLGLEGFRGKSSSSRYQETFASPYQVVWSNQWEPKASIQYASEVYQYHWGCLNHVNDNIHEIAMSWLPPVPEHDMLVGGFPCQDYSVANTLRNSGGIEGKKGVLWWDIHRILDRLLKEEGRPTKYLMLENVDRLLISPSGQRGRDFAIMLGSLADLGYIVEWRVINAADYGMPQRRRRVFIVGYHESTALGERAGKANPGEWIEQDGVIAKAFPSESNKLSNYHTERIHGNPYDITVNFNSNGTGNRSPFANAGLLVGRDFYTKHVSPYPLQPEEKLRSALRNFLDYETDMEPYFVNKEIAEDTTKGWAFHKGPKSKLRTDPRTGFQYQWSEGGMSLTDDLDKPARTIITSEGGPSPSRSKHLIKNEDGSYRRLSPLELERVSMFPDDYTKYAVKKTGEIYEVQPSTRAFFIGNALVVGIVERLGLALAKAVGRKNEV